MINVSRDLTLLAQNNVYNNSVVDEGNTVLVTSRVSLNMALSYHEIAEIIDLYSVLPLHRENGETDPDSIRISVMNENHRRALGIGMFNLPTNEIGLLKEELLKRAQSLSSKCPSISLPFSGNENKFFHVFIDLDKKSDNVILCNDEAKTLFITKWMNYLKTALNATNINVYVSRPKYLYGGVHIQVHGCKVSVDNLKKLWMNANLTLGTQLKSDYDLEIDTKMSSLFISGSSKDGSRSSLYRDCFSNTLVDVFPVCNCNCTEVHIRNDDNSTESTNSDSPIMNYILQFVIGDNINYKSIWDIVSNSMLQKIEEQNKPLKRRSYDEKDVGFTLVLLAYSLGNNEKFKCHGASPNERIHHLLSKLLDELKTEPNDELSSLESYVYENINDITESASRLITFDCNPDIGLIYTLFHQLLWIQNDSECTATVTVNGNSFRPCFLLSKLMKHFLHQSRNQESIIRKINTTTFANIAASIATPFDGQFVWSGHLKPYWVEMNEDLFRSNELRQNLVHLSHASIEFIQNKPLKPLFDIRLQETSQCISAIWRPNEKITFFPESFLITINGDIIDLVTNFTFRNSPSLRFEYMYKTGFTSSMYTIVSKNANYFEKVFDTIEFHNTNGFETTMAAVNEIAIPESMAEFVSSFNMPRVVNGIRMLMEMFESKKRLLYVISLIISIVFWNKRKMVIFMYSDESNHGKSTFLSALNLLFGEHYFSIPFPCICVSTQSDDKNPALAKAAGRMFVAVDEVPSSISSKRDVMSQISLMTLRKITSDSADFGKRGLYQNPKSMPNNSAIAIACNKIPSIASCGKADLSRFHFVKFPHSYEASHKQKRAKKDKSNLSQTLKIGIEVLTHLFRLKKHNDLDINQQHSDDYNECISYFDDNRNIAWRFFCAIDHCERVAGNFERHENRLREKIIEDHQGKIPCMNEILKYFKDYYLGC